MMATILVKMAAHQLVNLRLDSHAPRRQQPLHLYARKTAMDLGKVSFHATLGLVSADVVMHVLLSDQDVRVSEEVRAAKVAVVVFL